MQSPFSNSNPLGASASDSRFSFQSYIIKRRALQLVGSTLYLYGPNEQLVLWGARKAFKLKEDLRFYTDDTKSEEVLRIAARSILDFSAAYDVFDSRTNQKIGAFKRQGLKSSLVQDTWIIMDLADREVGQVQEDSALLGMLRRYVEYVSLVLPQKYTATIGAMPVATYARHSNPFSSRLDIDFSGDQNSVFDRRLGLALAMLLESIENKN